jgi:hypothetical protein
VLVIFNVRPPDNGNLVTETYVGVIIHTYKQSCGFVGLI